MLKQKAKLRTFRILTITLLMVLSVLLTTIFSIYNTKVFALTTTTINSAYRPGANAANATPELYENGEINGNVIYDLRQILFPDKDKTPEQYIQEIGNNEHDGRVINARTINANVAAKTGNVKHNNYGMVVRINGIDWIVASMTLANNAYGGDKANDIVLTLYQANSTQLSQFYTDSTDDVGTNMYASSTLRKNLTENIDQYKFFNDKSEGSFASQYLVQPKHITYQGKETQRGREHPVENSNYHLPNDSYYAFVSVDTWHPNIRKYAVEGGISFQGAYDNPVKYEAWKEDYIWIPSGTETGWDDFLENSSIWQLTPEQRAHSNVSWVRSGGHSSYSYAYAVGATGRCASLKVDNNAVAVRPAIHFNLTSAGIFALDPTAIETTYDGNDQELQSIAKNQNVSWYNEQYYERISLEYYKETEPSTISKDNPIMPNEAGTYWVRAQIDSNWLDKKGNTPKFAGKPGTNPDGGEAESDMLRWFKITIKKKDLNITLNLNQTLTGGGTPFLKERLA